MPDGAVGRWAVNGAGGWLFEDQLAALDQTGEMLQITRFINVHAETIMKYRLFTEATNTTRDKSVPQVHTRQQRQ